MDLKAKQDYLFSQILQANYDPEVFQEYIEKYKGVNLESYTMDELISIVQRFKGNESGDKQESNKIQTELKEKLQNISSSNAKEEIQKNEQLNKMEQSFLKFKGEQKKKDSFNTSTKMFHQLIKKTQFSKLFKRMHQDHETIRVKIRSYSKEDEHSILGGTYITYLLQTSIGWSVKRRFKDFQWLHSKLSLMYPGFPIPPTPKKTAIRSFEDKHLEERMIFFEHFINRLLQIPQICSDEIIEEFMSIGNQQQFAVCKERFQIKLSNNSNKITSLKGDRVINMSEYAVDLKQAKFHNSSFEIIKTLNNQLSAFQKCVKLASERAFQLSSTFAQAYKHFESNKVSHCQILQLMGDFVNQLGYRLDSEYFFVKNNLQDYFSYEEKYQQNLINSIIKINKEQYDILNKSKNITMEEQADIGEAYSKNKTLGEYLSNKELYRIKLSFILDELERHKTSDFRIIAKEWVAALQQYVGGIKDMMLSGADQLTKGMCICEGKKLVEVQYLSRPHVRQSHQIPR